MDDNIFQFKAPVYLDFKNTNDFNVMGDEFFDHYREDGEEENVSDSTENDSSTADVRDHSFRRSLSVDAINNLTNEHNKQNLLLKNKQSKEYECLAEQIRQFHFKTPDRFKSNPKSSQLKPSQPYRPVHTTIAQSPHLATKMRSRPTTHILTAEEREIMEMEEIKKNQFKAHEINKNIFKVPKCTKIVAEKKSTTSFEPFKLTEVKKKIAPPAEEFKFQANPVQKKMFESVIGIPKRKPLKLTNPKTPTFMKESRLRSKHLGINSIGLLEYQDDAHHGIKLHKSPKPTKVIPFNVIKRGEDSQKRKEERIKQIMEEERKMREFHAKPAPKFLRPKSNSNSDVTSISGTSSQESNEENHISTLNNFKARPATVLQKKPFQPVLKPRPLIEVKQFQLALDERIKKREEFEQKIKERDAKMKETLQEQEELKKIAEQEELNRLRQETITKAQPIKKFKEFILKPSAIDLTSPHTPKFSSRIRK